MAENNFLNYKGKPLVRSGKEIFRTELGLYACSFYTKCDRR